MISQSKRTLLLFVIASVFAVVYRVPGWAADSTLTDLLVEPEVNVVREGDGFQIRARVPVSVTRCEAYRFITDYESATAIPGVLESRIISRNSNKVQVNRLVRESILFVPIRLRSVIEYTEIADRGVEFNQLQGDALRYQGSWMIEPTEQGVEFRYNANFVPNSAIPMFVIQYFISNRMKQQFSAVARLIRDQKPKLTLACKE